MKRILFLLLFFTLAVLHCVKAQAIPTWMWSQQIGGSGGDYSTSVARDVTGNTIATGFFEGTIQLGNTTLSCPTGSYRNLYVAKYDPQGTLLWARQAGNAGPSPGYAATSLAVTTDGTGNVYVVGDYTGTISFGVTLTSTSNGINGFVVKYSAAGNPLWARSISGNLGCGNKAVAVDSNDNILVAGAYTGTISFGTASLTSSGLQDTDVFLAKYTNQGVVQWARTLGGPSNDDVTNLKVDAQGNVYLTGIFASLMTFGTTSVLSNGQNDVFLAKYDVQGILSWANSYGGTSDDFGTSLAVDATGRITLSGVFNGNATFGFGSSLVSRGLSDGFILQCSTAGALLWVYQFGGSGNDDIEDVVVSLAGDIYALGAYEGTISVGNQSLTSTGLQDIFVTRLSTTGTPVWSVRGGGTGDDNPGGLALGNGGLLSIGVRFQGTAQFGPFTSTSRGQVDASVFQLQDNTPLGTVQSGLAEWSVYPNPFVDEVTITTPRVTGAITVSLLDISGKVILQQSIPSVTLGRTYQFSTASIAKAGIYLLQLKSDEGLLKTYRLLKSI